MKLSAPRGEGDWEAWREGAVVHTRTSSGSGKLRTNEKVFPDDETAEKDLQAKLRAKFREGFIFQSDQGDAEWNLRLMFHVSRAYTGFLSLDYSQRDELIAAGRPNQAENTPPCELLLLDARDATLRGTLSLKAFDLWQARFDPRGPEVYVRAEGKVVALDPATEARTPVFATPPFTFLDFRLSRDGRRILGSDHSRMIVMELESGSILLEAPLDECRDHRHSQVADLSPSGRLVALCRKPGAIELFDLDNGIRRTLTGGFPYASKLLIHPSERFLILAEHYAEWGLWVIDAQSGEELTDFHPREDSRSTTAQKRWPCRHIDLSGDGKLLARGDDHTIYIHDFETGDVTARLEQEFAVKANGFDFTFAGTSDTLLSRVDLGLISLYGRQPPR